MLFLRNFGQIITIIVSVASKVSRDCIYLKDVSGFVQLLPIPVLNKDLVFSMEMMVKNCESISLTIYSGKNYNLTMDNEDMYPRDYGNIDRFILSETCTGL